MTVETVELVFCPCTQYATERVPLRGRLIKLDNLAFTIQNILGAWSDRWTYFKVTKAVVDLLKVTVLYEKL